MNPVAICNMALGWIGANKITSLDDEMVEAELCKAQFDDTIKAVLAERAWLFATGFHLVGPSAASPHPLFPSAWPLANTAIAVRGADDGSGEFSVKYLKAKKQVLTESISAAELLVKTTDYISDPGDWDPLFCRSVAALLASDLAVPLTEGSAMTDRMEKKYRTSLVSAGIADAMQGSSEKVQVKTASLKNVR